MCWKLESHDVPKHQVCHILFLRKCPNQVRNINMAVFFLLVLLIHSNWIYQFLKTSTFWFILSNSFVNGYVCMWLKWLVYTHSVTFALFWESSFHSNMVLTVYILVSISNYSTDINFTNISPCKLFLTPMLIVFTIIK